MNAGNLLPLKESFAERMVRFSPPSQVIGDFSESGSASEDLDWGSDIDQLPEGVRVVPTEESFNRVSRI